MESVFHSIVGFAAYVTLDGVLGKWAGQSVSLVTDLVAPSALGDGRMVASGDEPDLCVEHVNATQFGSVSVFAIFVYIHHGDGRGGIVSHIRKRGLQVRGSEKDRVQKCHVTVKLRE